MVTRRRQATIESVNVSTYRIPTEQPESDGTLEWDSTTLVLVRIGAAGHVGLGYTYADSATARVIQDRFRPLLLGRDALAISGCWEALLRSVRNLGSAGVCAMALSGVDVALWDLKARLLELPLVTLLGQARECVPVYGSGGFTSYTIPELERQLRGWAEAGIGRVKMKIGRDAVQDRVRVRSARLAIGGDVELFVDANGAYSRKLALSQAQAFADSAVSWFEEPVSSDDLEGLRLLRDRAPPGMEITAGEYGYDTWYFRRMCGAGAVDVLQADATRCGGVTGFLRAAAVADSFLLPLSSHCAPSIHAHLCCAAPRVRHLEYFHDHVRIEQMLFEGVLKPIAGDLRPDLSRVGLGLDFKEHEAQRFVS
jgi:L-alanine-DL-glutamate epimerase-like enolase superfamily enzyme